MVCEFSGLYFSRNFLFLNLAGKEVYETVIIWVVILMQLIEVSAKLYIEKGEEYGKKKRIYIANSLSIEILKNVLDKIPKQLKETTLYK